MKFLCTLIVIAAYVIAVSAKTDCAASDQCSPNGSMRCGVFRRRGAVMHCVNGCWVAGDICGIGH
ncbi:hypothetical protein HBI68_150630, partial [Parastagonospora nodorum]